MDPINDNELAPHLEELKALRRENEILAQQVKRLVQAEGKLYEYQEQLDAQLKQYKDLYDLNKKLSRNVDIKAIFAQAACYVTESLGYQRAALFLRDERGERYALSAQSGYFDPAQATALQELSLAPGEPPLSSLLAHPDCQVCRGEDRQDDLVRFGDAVLMREYLLSPLGAQQPPLAFIAAGNDADSVRFYRRVTGCEEEMVQFGNLVGLVSSALENQLLYAGLRAAAAESKRTEESLVKLSLAVEQSPVTIVITDREGRIEFVNPKFTQLTGYSREEALGQNPRILKSDITPPELHRELWTRIAAGEVWEGDFYNRKKNGEIFAEHATISPIRNREGEITHYLAIKEDITERRQLEAQLFQSQKMESIGRLAGGVAHDFNNMLSVILGCVQLAMLRVDREDKLWQYLDQIAKAGQRSSDITRQLLAFSRKEIISPRELNLNAQIVETQATLARLIGEDIRLTFKPVTNIWSIKADPSQVDQILVNLVVNARDAMEDGGQLAIETANVHIDRSYTQYHLDAVPGDYVRMVVSDSGTGMDRQILAHIFEPFFTTKGVGKGTGLGLATVYGIVRQNNGFINVYSEPGHGTTFQIYFPRSLKEVEPGEKGSEAEVAGSGTVLLVEDDPLVRAMSLQMLEQIGYRVIEAETPVEALEICGDTGLAIDLVLTDVVMPEMNGKEMVDRIEKVRPGIKVLFMSGYTSDLVAQRGVVDEGRHFIQKPFDLHALAAKIREALEGSSSGRAAD